MELVILIYGNIDASWLKKIKIGNMRYAASFFRQENDEYIEIDGERFYEDLGPSD